MIVILALIFAVNIIAQPEGALNTELLNRFESTLPADAYLKSTQNAVSANDIQKLALNRALVGTIDHHFAHRIETPGITDQQSSGRCWLFTSLNVLRPRVVAKYNLKDFEFSENYLFFWDQLEKANLFLEAIIETRKLDIDDRKVQWLFENPIADGGVWSMMPSLVKKYGVIPAEIMPDTYNTSNTSMIRRLLRRKLREDGLRLREYVAGGKNIVFLREKKEKVLGDIYRMLVIAFGNPPQQFNWRYLDQKDSLIVGKTYTPLEFYSEVVEGDLNDFVMLMNDPTKEYYQLYEIEYDRNCFDSRNWTFINLPVAEIKQYALKSILADEPLYFSCDVGKQLNREEGLLVLNQYDYESLFGVSFGMNKKDRILSYESASTHGMALVGVDTNATGQPTKWLLENSWGDDAGQDGFLTMTDDWLDEYMFRMVVHKRFLPEKVLAVLKQKPVLLPPWDRMF
jgi:bleomycin hydrolase